MSGPNTLLYDGPFLDFPEVWTAEPADTSFWRIAEGVGTELVEQTVEHPDDDPERDDGDTIHRGTDFTPVVTNA